MSDYAIVWLMYVSVVIFALIPSLEQNSPTNTNSVKAIFLGTKMCELPGIGVFSKQDLVKMHHCAPFIQQQQHFLAPDQVCHPYTST